MIEKIAIHETAFVTSAFRAADPELSKDKYAQLWPIGKTSIHAEKYANTVSEYEPFAHCLRNRYFYETLNQLTKIDAIETLINFGCGFSMYPFLLPGKLKHIEIDKADVIDFKKQRIKTWTSQGRLPKRAIQYLAGDFNQENMEPLLTELNKSINTSKCFILIEGVLFFLAKEATSRLFGLFNSLQKPNDYIGSVSFRPEVEKTTVFRNLIDFVEINLNKNEQFNYQTIDDTYYHGLSNYELMEHRHTLSLAKKYAVNKKLTVNEVLNEHMYILKKVS